MVRARSVGPPAGASRRGAPMSWPRAVSVECDGRVGAGCVVAPGLVLTVLHIVRPRREGGRTGPCVVGLMSGDGRAVAEVAWHREDAALLRFRPSDLAREFAPVRWGELTCTSPAMPVRCFAVGLPEAAKRRLEDESSGQVWQWRAPETAEGHINVVDTDGLFYSLQVDSAVPTGQAAVGSSPWEGMSGAGLFHEDFLLGTVQQAVPDRGNARLEAIPARKLLDDRGFCDIVERACGTRPQLEPADLEALFENAPQPAAAASYLLTARAETVGFLGLDTEMQLLLDWCVGPRTVDVAVVAGTGGVGKTRLAVELARRLSERRPQAGSGDLSWSAGFLDTAPTAQSPAYTMLRHLLRPVLVVIDYAEYRPQQVGQLLRTLANHRAPGQRVRLLLLARSTRDWWTGLRIRHPALVSGPEIALTPQAALRQSDASEVHEHAQFAFRRRIAALRWSGLPDDWNSEEFLEQAGRATASPSVEVAPTEGEHTMLDLHMDTLAQVLVDAPLTDGLDPCHVLLAHEEKYWERAAAQERQEHLDPSYLKALIALQRMAGAGSRDEADDVIRTAWDAHYADAEDAPVLHPDAISAKRRMLRGLYPPTGGSYWGGVGPDALTAKLISDIEEDSGQEFLAQILTSPRLSPRQRRHCLTILGRAVASHPELADSAASAVASHAELLRRDAEDLLATLPDRARDVWQRALAQAQREPEASHAQAELRDGQQEPERHPAPGAGASLTRPDRTTPELPPTPDDDTAPAPPPSAPQGLPPVRPTPPVHMPAPPPRSTPSPSTVPAHKPVAPKTVPRALAPPRRTVPIRIRDYLGFDAHGMRRVLGGIVALITVLAVIAVLAN
ncbi:trypsin-like peptidase domain-containing protein [Kitasatospora purpeofusca]|uniref:trypsin-like peptidase domain-containing protein n=1 Tax=Kitasatospora purpeofusca TaxID=67352 RepID=UPI002B1D820C|nr:trypsin-like peptidase domain-containing protein [Kitasatospora purpeofusca]